MERPDSDRPSTMFLRTLRPLVPPSTDDAFHALDTEIHPVVDFLSSLKQCDEQGA